MPISTIPDMSDFRVRKISHIDAELTVPGDKSISHRAVLMASLSNGPCLLRGFLPSEDCLCTVEAMRTLGVEIETLDQTTLRVHGRKKQFDPPKGPIDCGNSGTLMRLLSGVLAAQPFESRLIGDPSLSTRPMKRIITPLQRMGADITAEGENHSPPLVIRGGQLEPLHYESPVASAQVKSAILFAGLQTRGRTTVVEPVRSRDHTERMFDYFLVRTTTNFPKAAPGHPRPSGPIEIIIHGEQTPESRDFQIPGDISSAAFWLVAAAANPESQVLVRHVGLNDTRTGILGILLRMGAQTHESVTNLDQVERMGSIRIGGAALRGTVIAGEEIPNVIDEIPVLAVAGALAEGVTVIKDARELRVKETDRIAAVAENLRAMGVEVVEYPDGMEIHGGARLKGARLKSFGDHRIAMAFAVAGLFASGETIIEDVDCVETSYPGFADHLRLIQSGKRERIKLAALTAELLPPSEESNL